MLSEDAKTCIRYLALPSELGEASMGAEWVTKGNSPRDFIPFVAGFCRDFGNEAGENVALNLEANQDESAQYLAGLLGLM